MVGTFITAFLSLPCGVASAQVAPVPVVVGPGSAGVLPGVPQAGLTEVGKAYHYSTIGQELAEAKAREDAAGKPVASNGKSHVGAASQARGGVDPLSAAFRSAVSCLCPSSSQLMTRLEAAGYRR
jgi:hypothetical protein